ncbi:MAG: hypothetical protein ACQESP_06590 [Candidatus Muiribacteriota bacterium]
MMKNYKSSNPLDDIKTYKHIDKEKDKKKLEKKIEKLNKLYKHRKRQVVLNHREY